MPTQVEVEVTKRPPALRGDTSQGGNNHTTLENSIKVNVRIIINTGTTIRVDTRTGEYTERVS